MIWRDSRGQGYEIVRIRAPEFIIVREDGQAVAEADGRTKVFYDEAQAENFLDSWTRDESDDE